MTTLPPVAPLRLPPFDPGFVPAVLWNRTYRECVRSDPAARRIAFALIREGGSVSLHRDEILSATHPAARYTLRYAERLLKFLLWQKGADHVLVAGADELAAELARIYHPEGVRRFDHDFMGRKLHRRALRIEACSFDSLPEPSSPLLELGGNLDGCRIGFDLGGSDRKAAALIDGKVVYSKEIAWSPYFEKDPLWHLAEIQDSLARAAAHLPRVDAIGGSAAGTYVNNEVRAASLFRGVPEDRFEAVVRPLFSTLRERWGGVPFQVINDGEVTALAGAMWLKSDAVLGLSMGTSQAVGYVTPEGKVTSWLNELAFAPVDYRDDAPADEWSGDIGCGVQYFSQQAVGRLAAKAGFEFPEDLPLPGRLVAVQEAMAAGDLRARQIYESIGVYLGYAIAHYAEFYEIRNLLLLGRVTSGEGGGIILSVAGDVLRTEFPRLGETIRMHMPDESEKRHGQAMAAASLPRLDRP